MLCPDPMEGVTVLSQMLSWIKGERGVCERESIWRDGLGGTFIF